MRRYHLHLFLSLIVPPILNAPLLVLHRLSEETVWLYTAGLAGLGVLSIFYCLTRSWMWGGITEESMYLFAALPATTAIILQGVAAVAFSLFDGGIFVQMELAGWITFVAGVIALWALFRAPTLLAKYDEKDSNKRPR